jgi:hypothetical protein
MKVISFFTRHGKYPEMAQRLTVSCQRLGLPHWCYEMPDKGDWKSSTNAKPRFILSTLLEMRCPLLWVDIDTEILRLPSLVWQNATDFAIYNWRADAGNIQQGPYDPSDLKCSSGVIYLGYTAPAIDLLVRWNEQMVANPTEIDDFVLDKTYKLYRPPVQALWLPKTYNWMTGIFGPPTGECVIRHDYVAGGHRK